MSIKLMTAVWELPIAGTEKLVLLALAHHADERDEARLTNRSLIALTGLSERAVQYATKALDEAGLLTRFTSPGNPVIYRLRLPS